MVGLSISDTLGFSNIQEFYRTIAEKAITFTEIGNNKALSMEFEGALYYIERGIW